MCMLVHCKEGNESLWWGWALHCYQSQFTSVSLLSLRESSLPAKHCDAVTFASKHSRYCGTKAAPPGVWLAPFLCLQGDKTVKVVPVRQQPPITVADLIAGAKYHLRVYSHELNSVSSKSVTFKTKAGETPPGQEEPASTVRNQGSTRLEPRFLTNWVLTGIPVPLGQVELRFMPGGLLWVQICQ